MREIRLQDIWAEFQVSSILLEHGYEQTALGHLKTAGRLFQELLTVKREKGKAASKSGRSELVAKTLIRYPKLHNQLTAFIGAVEVANTSDALREARPIHRVLHHMLRAEEKVTRHETPLLRRVASFVPLLLLVLSVVGFYAKLIYNANHGTNLPPVENQSHYFSFADSGKEAVLWVEFGQNKQLVWTKVPDAPSQDYRVDVHDFQVENPWALHHGGTVRWHVRASERGSITVEFPPETNRGERPELKDISIFFTDGDSRIRTARVTSDNHQAVIAHDLIPGRWITLPLTAEEKRIGKKTLKITSLTGYGVTISALVIRKNT